MYKLSPFTPEEMASYVSKYGLTENELVQSHVNCANSGLERSRGTPRIILPRFEVRQVKKGSTIT